MNSFKLSDVITEWVDGSVRVCYNREVVARLEYDHLAQITWVWVKPSYRRQGIAKLMLSEVERRTGLIARPLPPVSKLAQGLFR